ncbi:MAG: hypothetical protein ACXACT_18000, partial [Candidatus Thorarchaeota archaeon]
MKTKSTITILLVLVMTISIFVGNTAPTTDTNLRTLEVPQAPQTIAEAPTISSIYHSPVVPMNGISVTIVANINDTDGIDNATCHYRVNTG